MFLVDTPPFCLLKNQQMLPARLEKAHCCVLSLHSGLCSPRPRESHLNVNILLLRGVCLPAVLFCSCVCFSAIEVLYHLGVNIFLWAQLGAPGFLFAASCPSCPISLPPKGGTTGCCPWPPQSGPQRPHPCRNSKHSWTLSSSDSSPSCPLPTLQSDLPAAGRYLHMHADVNAHVLVSDAGLHAVVPSAALLTFVVAALPFLPLQKDLWPFPPFPMLNLSTHLPLLPSKNFHFSCCHPAPDSTLPHLLLSPWPPQGSYPKICLPHPAHLTQTPLPAPHSL